MIEGINVMWPRGDQTGAFNDPWNCLLYDGTTPDVLNTLTQGANEMLAAAMLNGRPFWTLGTGTGNGPSLMLGESLRIGHTGVPYQTVADIRFIGVNVIYNVANAQPGIIIGDNGVLSFEWSGQFLYGGIGNGVGIVFRPSIGMGYTRWTFPTTVTNQPNTLNVWFDTQGSQQGIVHSKFKFLEVNGSVKSGTAGILKSGDGPWIGNEIDATIHDVAVYGIRSEGGNGGGNRWITDIEMSSIGGANGQGYQIASPDDFWQFRFNGNGELTTAVEWLSGAIGNRYLNLGLSGTAMTHAAGSSGNGPI